MICSVEGCNRHAYCRGYCQLHYQRMLKTGELKIVRTNNKGKTCTVEHCSNKAYIGGLCKHHYNTLIKYPKDRKRYQTAPRVSNAEAQCAKLRREINTLNDRISKARQNYCNAAGVTTQLRWKRAVVALEAQRDEYRALLNEKTKSLNSKVAN